jgi:hypothetical protein
MTPLELDEIRARSQALTDAIKAATAHPEPLDYFSDPGQRSKVSRAISFAYQPTIRTLAQDLVSAIDAALAAEPEWTET